MTITRALVLDLNQHNQAIARARADYEAHPIASCRNSRHGGCDLLREADDNYYCPKHRAERDVFNERRRAA